MTASKISSSRSATNTGSNNPSSPKSRDWVIAVCVGDDGSETQWKARVLSVSGAVVFLDVAGMRETPARPFFRSARRSGLFYRPL